jgi:hypothetical protein
MLQITRFEENPQIGGRLFSPSDWGLLEPMMMNCLSNAYFKWNRLPLAHAPVRRDAPFCVVVLLL